MQMQKITMGLVLLMCGFEGTFASSAAAESALGTPTSDIQTTSRGTNICTLEGCTDWDQVVNKIQELNIPMERIVHLYLPEDIVKTLPDVTFKGLTSLESVIVQKGVDVEAFREKYLKELSHVRVVAADEKESEVSEREAALLPPQTSVAPVSPEEAQNVPDKRAESDIGKEEARLGEQSIPHQHRLKVQASTSDNRPLSGEITDPTKLAEWVQSLGTRTQDVTELVLPVGAPFQSDAFKEFVGLRKLTLWGNAPVMLNATLFRNFPQLQELNLRDLSNAHFETLELWYHNDLEGKNVSDSILDPKDERFKVCLNYLTKEAEQQLKEQLAPALGGVTPDQLAKMDIRDVLYRAFINTHPFKKECVSPFQECLHLQKVVLPETMTVIPAEIFQGAKALNEVYFPPKTKAVGARAFENCTALTNIDLSYTELVKIEESAFSGCSNLQSILLPPTLTSIGYRAFAYCSALKFSSFLPPLPVSLTDLGKAAFVGCSSLTKVDLSALTLVTQIPDYCFLDCSNLSSVILPPSVTAIGEAAFSQTALGTLDLSGYPHLTTIERSAFKECPRLETVILPESLQSLGFCDAFTQCPKLTKVDFSKCHLQSIRCAFRECTALKSVDLSGCEDLTQIETSAFSGCTALKTVQLPKGLTKIGDSAFKNCSSLEALDLERCQHLTSIGTYAFCEGRALRDLHVPASLTSIGRCAFSQCTGLRTADLSACETLKIGVAAFFETRSLTTVQFPETGQNWKIGDRAFKGSKVSGDLPHFVEEIGKDAWPNLD